MPDHATRVIAIRHGETAWNADKRLQGQTDIELNDTGQRQALRLAGALADAGITSLYASDLRRAMQTAQPIAARCGVALGTDAGLRERNFGIFEGQRWVDLERRWPEQARRWRERNGDFAPDGGETLAGFYARCVDSATRLAVRHPGETIAFVAHGGVLDCLYRAAARIPLEAPRTWQLGNASINRLLFNGESFTLVGWNDSRHLDAGLDDNDEATAAAERAT
ncbi:MAG TPA: histidine phosphatase family protein [Burkholderiaceae bacterium]|jgi:probable phosphoglycerate mutase|nr:histidine phosphatase family protein [Burkholderiaceae bacterium]